VNTVLPRKNGRIEKKENSSAHGRTPRAAGSRHRRADGKPRAALPPLHTPSSPLHADGEPRCRRLAQPLGTTGGSWRGRRGEEALPLSLAM